MQSATTSAAPRSTGRTGRLVLLALMAALIFVLQFVTVPLGAITVSLSMIPVGITAITLGPVYGAAAGAVWGLASLIKAATGASGMTTTLLNISVLRTLFICFVPRILDGFLLGHLYRLFHKVLKLNVLISGCLVGFCSAFLNTLFFMSSIAVLFYTTEYFQGLLGGKNVIMFIIGIIAGNAVFEMLTATVITGPVAAALSRARLFPSSDQN